jgi:hypothetical protein
MGDMTKLNFFVTLCPMLPYSFEVSNIVPHNPEAGLNSRLQKSKIFAIMCKQELH